MGSYTISYTLPGAARCDRQSRILVIICIHKYIYAYTSHYVYQCTFISELCPWHPRGCVCRLFQPRDIGSCHKQQRKALRVEREWVSACAGAKNCLTAASVLPMLQKKTARRQGRTLQLFPHAHEANINKHVHLYLRAVPDIYFTMCDTLESADNSKGKVRKMEYTATRSNLLPTAKAKWGKSTAQKNVSYVL